MRRQAGVVLPIFSLRTRRDWGIGQITDLPACADFVLRSGHRLLQILPPHELSTGETSPYGALTAFGIDSIYADVEAIEDLDSAAIADALGEQGRAALARARASDRVDYGIVREIKNRVLARAFARFVEAHWVPQTPRAARLAAFVERERAWLHDLGLYCALREAHGGWGWETWPEGERRRLPAPLEDARRRHERRILEVAYVQWTLLEQWDEARARMREAGVELMGDLPFIVCDESADVWSHATEFDRQVVLGAPPDDFSADGQDWGLPAYAWAEMDKNDLAWLRARARHAARLYDRFRLDHVVGYFRQWVRPREAPGRGRFDPAGEADQFARGLRVLGVMIEELTGPGCVDPPRAIAEDLGVIPWFVRGALGELAMPGYRVLPWERDGERYRDPRAFPRLSVASWSTHDTAPIDAWWDEFSEGDRAQLASRAGFDGAADGAERSLALLRDLYGARSDLVLVLGQELLGARDRLNKPATVGGQNWTWRLPRPIEDLAADRDVVARLDAIRRAVEASGR
ncbi:MAG TPA: 4-alpha-glucanotransferase [Polyangiaceae bacterium]|nr:4-alpha-glucanotransferase [Polyangiaceae bacterium]